MKTNDAKEKKFRELSDEELQNVTGGAKLPTVTEHMMCGIQSCPPGYKLDRSLEPCQCVEETYAALK